MAPKPPLKNLGMEWSTPVNKSLKIKEVLKQIDRRSTTISVRRPRTTTNRSVIK